MKAAAAGHVTAVTKLAELGADAAATTHYVRACASASVDVISGSSFKISRH